MTCTIKLHSCLSIERRYGVNRHTVRGLISGLGLRTYRGSKGAVAIDDDGLSRLLAHLRADGTIESQVNDSRD